MDFEQIMLIAIAVLSIIDGQGMALRILRLLMQLMGESSNVEKTKSTEAKK